MPFLRCAAMAAPSPSTNCGASTRAASPSSPQPNSPSSFNLPVIHEKSPDSGCQRLHRPSPVQTHSRNDRLGSVRDGHADRAPWRPHQSRADAFLRRRHHDQQGVGRVSREEVRRDPAARRDRHAGYLRQAAAARVRTGLRGEPAHRAFGCEVRQAPRVPVHLRGLRHVHGRAVRPGRVATVVRPDQQAALDLRVLEAVDGPRDLGLRHGRPELHAVPSVQLDRPGPRLDLHAEGRQLARGHAVPRPYRARREHQPRRRRRAKACLHGHRRRHRRADEDHREQGRRRDRQDL